MKKVQLNNPPVTSPKKNLALGISVAAAVLFAIIAVSSLQKSSQMKADMEIMAKQNEELRQELDATQAKLDTLKDGITKLVGKKAPVKTATAKPKPVKDPETLLLQQPTVSQTASGLVARFKFKPTTKLPEKITLQVRIPETSGAKILSLKPVDESGYSHVGYVVNAEGSVGRIDGSPSDPKALVFDLKVSKPVTATVRGSKGIRAFAIDIAPGKCSIRHL